MSQEFEKISIPKVIKDMITAPIPENLIKQREGGGKKMLSYLSGSTITDMLNNAFGYVWSWEVKNQWIEKSEPAVNKYANGTFQKDSSKWTLDPQGPVAHVLGTLTVWVKQGPQLIPIRKDGFGSKSVLGKQNDQESVYKAAGTDALKKAASLLGIGLELYRDEDEANYFYEMNYEDPWTDEALEKCKEDIEYIKKYKEEYQVSEDDFNNYVYQLTGYTYDVNPDNISDIVKEIKDGIAAAE